MNTGHEYLPTPEADSRHLPSPSITDVLDARRFSLANPPPESVPRFYVGDAGICTPGNLCAISAAAKSGKTSFIAAMLGATLANGSRQQECLGVRSPNPKVLAVLHFDTEQSRHDHWSVIRTSMRRAGVDKIPAWFRSYCITGFTIPDIKAALELEFKRAVEEHGGIHSVIIDGVADIVADVNDPEESNGFVAELHSEAIRLDCPIVGVIHVNPGSEKTRGHLGSQLERKAETNLRLEKDGETVLVWSDKNRRAPIPKDAGPRFAWDAKLQMHALVESLGASRDNAKAKRLREVAVAVFVASGKSAMAWKEMITGIATQEIIGTSGARKQFDAMRGAGIIQQDTTGAYVLTP